MKSDKILSNFLVLFILYLILTFLIRALLHFTPDSEFILYRFAEHLKHGTGLIYGTVPPPVTTYPVVPVLLILPANLIFIATVAAGAVLLVYILNARWHIGLLYVLLLSAHNSTLAAVLLAVSLSSIALTKGGSWMLAGLLAAVAILTDGSAIIPALLLFFVTFKKPSMWRYAIPAFAAPLAVYLIARSATPNLIIASTLPSFISILVLLVAIYAFARGWKKLAEQPYSALLVMWSSTVVLLSALGHTLPSAALLPGLLALVALLPISWLALAAGLVEFVWLIGIFPQLSIPQVDKHIVTASSDEAAEQAVGEWIHSNIVEQDTLATREIGALAYYADRTVIDLSGRLQPVEFDKAFFLRYGPASIVLEREQAVPWEPFKTTYAHTFSAGQYEVYQRVVRFAALNELPLDLVFTGNLRRNDLKLYGVAVGNQVQPGDFVPVRLDWKLAYVPSFDTEIKLELVNSDGSIAASAVDTLKPEQWHAGNNSTYHLLVLPKETSEGVLSLNVTFGLHGGVLGTQKVAETTVKK